MKRYRVLVIEAGQETRIIGRAWERKASGEQGYEYTPEVEATRDYERNIYEQLVDDIDLPKVIAAVNKLDFSDDS